MQSAPFAFFAALGLITLFPATGHAQAPGNAARPQPQAPSPTTAPPTSPQAEGTPPPAAAEAPAPAPSAPPSAEVPPAPKADPFAPVSLWPDPNKDAEELRKQGALRPKEIEKKRAEPGVFSDDWWTHARPIIEFHGSYRLRWEMFYQFALGRSDPPSLLTRGNTGITQLSAMWPHPADNFYLDSQSTFRGPQQLCTAAEAGIGSDTTSVQFPCSNNTQTGANMRFRIEPELHISDNLRIMTQIDMLDNLVLGSTPEGYANVPGASGGYVVAPRSGYNSIGFLDSSQTPPRSGVNSFKDSIMVKRVWAEYSTPLGELRFGRMPNHWGLGIYNNAGNGYDDDYGSTIDRVQFTTGLKSLDLYVSGTWDYPNEGATSEQLGLTNAQPYDVAQLDDVYQYTLSIMRRKGPELTRLALGRGDVLLNGGLQVTHRWQTLAADDYGRADGAGTLATGGTCTSGGNPLGCYPGQLTFVRRDATAWIFDPWFQLLYRKFRFEAEAVLIFGSMLSADVGSQGNEPNSDNAVGYRIRQQGFAGEIEQKLVEDRMRLGLNFGWASGDPDVDGLVPSLDRQRGDNTISTFRFHPSYHVDLILHRNLLSRVQGTYYLRPSFAYDFMKEPNGQKIGGTLAGIWTRASEFMQSPGHAPDLGIELNAGLYFQSKDGMLNDNPARMGGFYARLEYGVLFPLAGLGYPAGTAALLSASNIATDTHAAQIFRVYLGAAF